MALLKYSLQLKNINNNNTFLNEQEQTNNIYNNDGDNDNEFMTAKTKKKKKIRIMIYVKIYCLLENNTTNRRYIEFTISVRCLQSYMYRS